MTGSTQQTDSAQISEQSTLQGGIVIVPEQVSLSELLQMVGGIQQTENAQISEQYSMLGTLQSTDLVQLSELIPVIVQGGTAIFIAPPDSVLLSESVSLVGSIKVTESVQTSDSGVATVFPTTNVIVYARGGNVTVFTRQGNSKVFTRSGNITLNEE
jgi:hypothetical protein